MAAPPLGDPTPESVLAHLEEVTPLNHEVLYDPARTADRDAITEGAAKYPVLLRRLGPGHSRQGCVDERRGAPVEGAILVAHWLHVLPAARTWEDAVSARPETDTSAAVNRTSDVGGWRECRHNALVLSGAELPEWMRARQRGVRRPRRAFVATARQLR